MLGLEHMLNELQSHQLTTVLAPSKRADRREWDMIRVNMDINPAWYRRLCSRHPSQRGIRHGKFDTAIRRAHILNALERMTAGKKSHSPYADELRRIASKFHAIDT